MKLDCVDFYLLTIGERLLPFGCPFDLNVMNFEEDCEDEQ